MRPKVKPKSVSISVQCSTAEESVGVDHGYAEECWETVLETQLTQKFDSDSESDGEDVENSAIEHRDTELSYEGDRETNQSERDDIEGRDQVDTVLSRLSARSFENVVETTSWRDQKEGISRGGNEDSEITVQADDGKKSEPKEQNKEPEQQPEINQHDSAPERNHRFCFYNAEATDGVIENNVKAGEEHNKEPVSTSGDDADKTNIEVQPVEDDIEAKTVEDGKNASVPSTITGVITKPTKRTKAGIAFSKHGDNPMTIGMIHEGGLFSMTDLVPGMEVVSVNGTSIAGMTAKQAAQLIRAVAGEVSVEGRFPKTVEENEDDAAESTSQELTSQPDESHSSENADKGVKQVSEDSSQADESHISETADKGEKQASEDSKETTHETHAPCVEDSLNISEEPKDESFSTVSPSSSMDASTPLRPIVRLNLEATDSTNREEEEDDVEEISTSKDEQSDSNQEDVHLSKSEDSEQEEEENTKATDDVEELPATEDEKSESNLDDMDMSKSEDAEPTDEKKEASDKSMKFRSGIPTPRSRTDSPSQLRLKAPLSLETIEDPEKVDETENIASSGEGIDGDKEQSPVASMSKSGEEPEADKVNNFRSGIPAPSGNSSPQNASEETGDEDDNSKASEDSSIEKKQVGKFRSNIPAPGRKGSPTPLRQSEQFSFESCASREDESVNSKSGNASTPVHNNCSSEEKGAETAGSTKANNSSEDITDGIAKVHKFRSCIPTPGRKESPLQLRPNLQREGAVEETCKAGDNCVNPNCQLHEEPAYATAVEDNESFFTASEWSEGDKAASVEAGSKSGMHMNRFKSDIPAPGRKGSPVRHIAHVNLETRESSEDAEIIRENVSQLSFETSQSREGPLEDDKTRNDEEQALDKSTATFDTSTEEKDLLKPVEEIPCEDSGEQSLTESVNEKDEDAEEVNGSEVVMTTADEAPVPEIDNEATDEVVEQPKKSGAEIFAVSTKADVDTCEAVVDKAVDSDSMSVDQQGNPEADVTIANTVDSSKGEVDNNQISLQGEEEANNETVDEASMPVDRPETSNAEKSDAKACVGEEPVNIGIANDGEGISHSDDFEETRDDDTKISEAPSDEIADEAPLSLDQIEKSDVETSTVEEKSSVEAAATVESSLPVSEEMNDEIVDQVAMSVEQPEKSETETSADDDKNTADVAEAEDNEEESSTPATEESDSVGSFVYQACDSANGDTEIVAVELNADETHPNSKLVEPSEETDEVEATSVDAEPKTEPVERNEETKEVEATSVEAEPNTEHVEPSEETEEVETEEVETEGIEATSVEAEPNTEPVEPSEETEGIEATSVEAEPNTEPIEPSEETEGIEATSVEAEPNTEPIEPSEETEGIEVTSVEAEPNTEPVEPSGDAEEVEAAAVEAEEGLDASKIDSSEVTGDRTVTAMSGPVNKIIEEATQAVEGTDNEGETTQDQLAPIVEELHGRSTPSVGEREESLDSSAYGEETIDEVTAENKDIQAVNPEPFAATAMDETIETFPDGTVWEEHQSHLGAIPEEEDIVHPIGETAVVNESVDHEIFEEGDSYLLPPVYDLDALPPMYDERYEDEEEDEDFPSIPSIDVNDSEIDGDALLLAETSEEKSSEVSSVGKQENITENDHKPLFDVGEIIDLVEERRWNDITARMKAFPSTASVPISGSNKLSKNFLLHEICKHNPPVELVKMVLGANEDAAKTKGQWGYLPLHCACTSGSSIAVVQELLKANPEAVSTVDRTNRMLPLHLACRWGAPESVLVAVVKAYPKATQVHDAYEKVPMDYALNLPTQNEQQVAVACLEQGMLLLSKKSEEVDAGKDSTQEPQLESEVQQDGGELSDKFSDLESKLTLGLSDEASKREALELAIQKQENEYKHLLESEREKATMLEVRIHDMEKSQMVQEHSEEAKIKELSLRFDNLEAQLRRDLDEENAKRAKRERALEVALEAQGRTYQGLLAMEKQKVESLESAHSETLKISESEQRKVEVLEQTKAEIERELEAERQRVEQLDQAQSELRSRLESEFSKLETLKQSESEKHAQLESVQAKVTALEEMQAEKELLLESSRSKLELLEERLSESQSSLDIEQLKVAALTKKQTELESDLEAQRKNLISLDTLLSTAVADLESEREKLAALQEQEGVKQELLESEQEKSRNLERALAETQKLLETEHEKLKLREEELAVQKDLLSAEKDKVKLLESEQAAQQETFKSEQWMMSQLEEMQVEKKELLEADREVVKALEKTQIEKQALLKAEQEKTEALEKAKAAQDALLQAEQEKVEALDRTLAQKEQMLEAEQMKIVSLQQTISLKDALLESEQTKLKELEVIQNQKRMLLESEHKVVESLKNTKVEKEELLESEKKLIEELEQRRIEKEALLQSEEQKTKELAERKGETQELMEAEQRAMEALTLKQEEKRALWEEERRTVEALERTHAEKKLLLASEEETVKALELTRSQKYALLEAAKKKTNIFVRATLNTSKLFQEALLTSQVERALVRKAQKKTRALVRATLGVSSRIIQNPLGGRGKKIISKFLSYCNDLVRIKSNAAQNVDSVDDEC